MSHFRRALREPESQHPLRASYRASAAITSGLGRRHPSLMPSVTGNTPGLPQKGQPGFAQSGMR